MASAALLCDSLRGIPPEKEHMLKRFKDLTEREILALAITSEEEDGRIYGEFADALREKVAFVPGSGFFAGPPRREMMWMWLVRPM